MEFHLLLNTRGRFLAHFHGIYAATGSRAALMLGLDKNPQKKNLPKISENPQISMLMEQRKFVACFHSTTIELRFFEDSRNEDVIVFVVANANPAIH